MWVTRCNADGVARRCCRCLPAMIGTRARKAKQEREDKLRRTLSQKQNRWTHPPDFVRRRGRASPVDHAPAARSSPSSGAAAAATAAASETGQGRGGFGGLFCLRRFEGYGLFLQCEKIHRKRDGRGLGLGAVSFCLPFRPLYHWPWRLVGDNPLVVTPDNRVHELEPVRVPLPSRDGESTNPPLRETPSQAGLTDQQ